MLEQVSVLLALVLAKFSERYRMLGMALVITGSTTRQRTLHTCALAPMQLQTIYTFTHTLRITLQEPQRAINVCQQDKVKKVASKSLSGNTTQAGLITMKSTIEI